LDFRFWIFIFGFWILNLRFWIFVFCFSFLDFRFWIFIFGFWILNLRFWFSESFFRRLNFDATCRAQKICVFFKLDFLLSLALNVFPLPNP